MVHDGLLFVSSGEDKYDRMCFHNELICLVSETTFHFVSRVQHISGSRLQLGLLKYTSIDNNRGIKT